VLAVILCIGARVCFGLSLTVLRRICRFGLVVGLIGLLLGLRLVGLFVVAVFLGGFCGSLVVCSGSFCVCVLAVLFILVFDVDIFLQASALLVGELVEFFVGKLLGCHRSFLPRGLSGLHQARRLWRGHVL